MLNGTCGNCRRCTSDHKDKDHATNKTNSINSGEAIDATFVGGTADYDLAVIRLRRTLTNIKPIPMGASADLQVGQSLLAIGIRSLSLIPEKREKMSAFFATREKLQLAHLENRQVE